MEIGMDIATLAGYDENGNQLLNLAPLAHVYRRLSAIPDPPNTNSATSFSMQWSGQGYLSSVIRRVFIPTVQSKQVDMILSLKDEFVQMDEFRGTEFITDGFTLMDRPVLGYPYNEPYFVMSKSGGQGSISSFSTSTLLSFTMDADIPPGCSIKVAFSVAGGGSWRTWNVGSGVWDLLPGDSTLIQMQSAPEYSDTQTWNPIAWENLRLLGGTYITVCFLMMSSSMLITPKIRSYTWGYIEDGFYEDITDMFHRQFYSNRAVFQYKGGGPIDPPIVFTVYPINNRGKVSAV